MASPKSSRSLSRKGSVWCWVSVLISSTKPSSFETNCCSCIINTCSIISSRDIGGIQNKKLKTSIVSNTLIRLPNDFVLIAALNFGHVTYWQISSLLSSPVTILTNTVWMCMWCLMKSTHNTITSCILIYIFQLTFNSS